MIKWVQVISAIVLAVAVVIAVNYQVLGSKDYQEIEACAREQSG